MLSRYFSCIKPALLALFVLTGHCYSQTPEVIHVKKDISFLYFFQKGENSDTLVKNKSDVFYLLVPDSLKKSIYFSIENGQFVAAGNDSLVRLSWVPGIRYEYNYVVKEDVLTIVKKSGAYKSLISGTSDFDRGKIRVRILNSYTGKMMYELIYWYRPG